MNLDDKLREILPCINCGVDGDPADGYGSCTCGNEDRIAQIKQAFTDGHYIPYIPFGNWPKDQKPPEWWSKTPVLMSGQEWFDRFKEEISTIHPENLTIGKICKVAKRASGTIDGAEKSLGLADDHHYKNSNRSMLSDLKDLNDQQRKQS